MGILHIWNPFSFSCSFLKNWDIVRIPRKAPFCNFSICTWLHSCHRCLTPEHLHHPREPRYRQQPLHAPPSHLFAQTPVIANALIIVIKVDLSGKGIGRGNTFFHGIRLPFWWLELYKEYASASHVRIGDDKSALSSWINLPFTITQESDHTDSTGFLGLQRWPTRNMWSWRISLFHLKILRQQQSKI